MRAAMMKVQGAKAASGGTLRTRPTSCYKRVLLHALRQRKSAVVVNGQCKMSINTRQTLPCDRQRLAYRSLPERIICHQSDDTLVPRPRDQLGGSSIRL
jgi:hypothetical protein